jgi:formate-dependent phosphoribosylglycinamide formyltransferase (GAR transformylase)
MGVALARADDTASAVDLAKAAAAKVRITYR